MALTSLDTGEIVRLIDQASKRVAYLAPGVHLNVAHALAAAWRRLGTGAVNVILDARAEVYRLGYGSPEGFDCITRAAHDCGALVCNQTGVQVGILVADDTLAVFAPAPLMVAETEMRAGDVNGLVLKLDEAPERVAQQIGAGDTLLGQEFGLDPVRREEAEILKAELKSNPPQKFDLVRQLNVFNAQFEFVEMELVGSKMTQKQVTLPPDLSAITSEEVRKRLKTTYLVFDRNAKIAKAEQQLGALRKGIERRFLRIVPGYGFVIQRSDRDMFDKAIETLRAEVAKFQATVEGEMASTATRSIEAIAKALAPALKRSPTDEYKRWMQWETEPSAEAYVKMRLHTCFAEATKDVGRMALNVVFKGVTYESLRNERFCSAAKKAFPELKEVFTEFQAVRAVEEKQFGIKQ